MVRCSGRHRALHRTDIIPSPISAYYDLENPAQLDPTFGSYVPKVPVDLGRNQDGSQSLAHPGTKPVYSREHPYEAQMGNYQTPWCDGITDDLSSGNIYRFPGTLDRSVEKHSRKQQL